MKYFMLIGGFAGFSLTFATGLLAATEPGTALLNASVGCLAGAALMRGFRCIFTRCVRTVLTEKARLRTTGGTTA